ncbi:hypothetical protein [Nocardia thailandica]|uniref:hypothetical protein n=1 Tax=Nocardia thailandica TaxID=257275 RepID=UPI00030FCEF7|nr:hypothetical protein [Nocardia thailandica]
MDDRLWSLPGPRRFIAELVTTPGRHAAAVLPTVMADDPVVVDGLASAVIGLLRTRAGIGRRVNPAGSADPIDALRELEWDLPHTVGGILRHGLLAGDVAVLCAADLSPAARAALPALLARIDTESRALAHAQRLTVVTIGSRHDLPTLAGGQPDSPHFAPVWFWGRLSRWDTAAHVAAVGPTESGVLTDVRIETIVEVAAWDVDVAEELAQRWSGDPDELFDELRASATAAKPAAVAASGTFRVPPVVVRRDWDDRRAEFWHERIHPGAYVADDADTLRSTVWAAQARILLPWIEQRRNRLHALVRAALGGDYPRAVDLHLPGHGAAGPIEIGPLDRLIRHYPRLARFRDCSAALRDARNTLAHLSPMSLDQQNALVRWCGLLE